MTAFDPRGKKVWVAGHRGMVGSALVRRLKGEDCEILVVERKVADLRRQAEVEYWLDEARPDAILVAAATVGGILANQSCPADFLYDNLMIETNIIHAAYRVGVEKLLFLGSSCIYPKHAPQPMVEDALLSGSLEPTNEWYAVAKIAGVKLCQAYRRQHGCDFVSAIPTNLYGIGDNFDLETSHVLPALIAKAHRAKQSNATAMEVWGTGAPRREFLYVDDAADAIVFLMRAANAADVVNIGIGEDIAIRDLAALIARIVGFDGILRFDSSKPDGAQQKLLDVSWLASHGWAPSVSLANGIERAYAWYLEHSA